MDLYDWDRKFSALSKLTEQWEKEFQHRQNPIMSKLSKDNHQLLKKRKQLEKNIEAIITTNSKNRFLSERQRSFLYWAKETAINIDKLFRLMHQVMSFHAWFELVQRKIAGYLPKASYNFTQDLESYTNFFEQLKTKQNREISRLQRKITKLNFRFETLLTVAENRKAVETTQKFTTTTLKKMSTEILGINFKNKNPKSEHLRFRYDLNRLC